MPDVTDRLTEQNSYRISISRVSMLTRDKKTETRLWIGARGDLESRRRVVCCLSAGRGTKHGYLCPWTKESGSTA